jgi:hypothetical protein
MAAMDITAAVPVVPGPDVLPRRLGHAGLIPFVAGAGLVWVVQPEAHPYVLLALSTYAAAIVSFLGALHWGLAMRRPSPPPARWWWGIATPLGAWVGAMMPPASGLVVLGVLLVACYLVDRKVYRAEGLADWLTLRFRLSVVAALSCFLGAAGA